MAIYTIPDSIKRIVTKSRYDTDGIQTFNLDLTSKLDKIQVSKQLTKVLDEDTDLAGSVPVAFEIYKNQYYVLTDDDPYVCDVANDPTDSNNWSELLAVSSAVSSTSDLAVFNDLLLISNGGAAIYSWNGTSFSSSWSSGKLTTSGATFSQMYVWKGDGEWLFVANNNKVHYYSATAGEFIVTLPDDLEVVGFSGGVSRVWVATRSTTDQNAYVYEIIPGRVYNVTDANGAEVDTVPLPENAYEVEGSAAMSISVIDNAPYIVTDTGNIQAFNGAGFTTVASFPFANTTELVDNTAVHPKGMQAHNQSIYINISTDRAAIGDYPVDTPSGVWEFNRETGQLYHRFAFAEASGDYGWRETNVSLVGPLMITNNQYSFLFASGRREAASITGQKSGLFIDTVATYGYFITPEIMSGTVVDAWESVYQKAKTLSGSEKIRLKYRTVKKDRVLLNGAYASATVINTTADLGDVAVGWEVTDYLTGKTAHITAIDVSTTTQITLDTAIGTAAVNTRFEFNNWSLVPEAYTSDDGEVKRDGDFGSSPWIQFKVELVGDIEYRQFICKSNSKEEV